MLSAYLVALVCMHTNEPQTQHQVERAKPIVNVAHLGEAGFEAFKSPDQVTIQRVYPPYLGQKSAFLMGKWNVVASGKEQAIPKDLISSLIRDFQITELVIETACIFHPDHIYRFKKGRVAVEFLTCFTCGDMVVSLNGKQVGFLPLPETQSISDVRGLIPFGDDARARIDEFGGGGFYDALKSAKGARAFLLPSLEAVEPNKPPEKRSDPIPISPQVFEKFRTLFVVSPLVSQATFITTGKQPLLLEKQVMIEVSSKPPIQFFFPKNSFAQGTVKWGDKEGALKIRTSVFTAFYEELVRISKTD